jgi:hypothetical protein
MKKIVMPRRYVAAPAVAIAALIWILAGCAASRSPITGIYSGTAEKNAGAPKVSVFFLFRNLTQQHGMDSIPKLRDHGIKDFNNLFRDSLTEITNISQYTTFFESPNDINAPKRRLELDGYRSSHDFTVEYTVLEESSFKQQMLSGTVSLLSLTLIPMPYSWDYTITANLYDRNGKLIRSYQRKSTLDNWMQVFLIFAYPFHPLEGKREQIYSESMHDIFRQIEAEKVLKK